LEPKEPSAREENSTRESDGAANRYKISYDTDNGFSIIIERDVSEIENAEAPETNSDQTNEETTNTAEADLLAQEIMAHWTRWIGIFTALGLMALVVTLLITQQANAAAWAAVRTTEEVGKKQTRAYIGIESAKVEVKPGYGSYCFFYMKNYGQSPAHGIEIQTKIQFTITDKGKDWPTDKKIYRMRCNHPRTLAPGAVGRCGVFIQDEMNIISEMSLSEIRFYCTAHIWWLDVFCTDDEIEGEQEAHIVMSQPLGTWTSQHWRGELDVGGGKEGGSGPPRHTDLWLDAEESA